MASSNHVVFIYHGIHDRDLSCTLENRLFRNSISETAFRRQLHILGGTPQIIQRANNATELRIRNWCLRAFRILITFDDGYKNNFRAAEIFFDQFGTAPFTIFVTTNLVGSGRSIWTVELGLLLLQGRFLNTRLAFGDEVFEIDRPEKRLETFNSIRYRLKEMNAENRKQNCDLINEQALPGELERLVGEYPEFQMLNLDEIGQMQSMGVRFQPHGHNHELFHTNQDSEVIRKEIVESKEFIETKLNEKCTYFAYPNGDYCDAAISILKENGFSGAYTTNAGIAKTLERNFEIPRLTPNPKPWKFKRQLRGKTS